MHKKCKKNIGDWIFLQEKVRLKIVCQKKNKKYLNNKLNLCVEGINT